jgi:hypothetical protein
MNGLIFRLSVRERRTLGSTLLIALVVLSTVALVMTSGYGPVATGAAFAVILLLTLAGWTYNAGSTSVGASGITIRRGVLPSRTVPWEEVVSIFVHTGRSGFGAIMTIRVTTVTGRTFRVPALEDGIRRPDPEFDDKFEQIMDQWEQYA